LAKSVLRLLTQDFWLKVSALVIALGIWFYANSRVTDETACDATVVITPPPGYALVHQSARLVSVTVSGPRSLLSRLDRRCMQAPIALTAQVNETDLTDGQVSLPVESLWPRADLEDRHRRRLKFRAAKPAQVRAVACPLDERTLPVVAHVAVQPALGYRQAAAPAVTPAQVLVRGPALALAAMQDIETEELPPLYDVSSDVQHTVRVRDSIAVTLPTGERVPVPLEVSPPGVTVVVSVAGEAMQEQRFPNVRVLAMMPPGFPYQVEFGEGDGTVTVVVQASPANLRTLDPAQIRACVDLSPLAAEVIPLDGSAPYRERVHVQLPAGFIHGKAQAEPDRVNVLLRNPSH